jgi:hypothetical protein
MGNLQKFNLENDMKTKTETQQQWNHSSHHIFDEEGRHVAVVYENAHDNAVLIAAAPALQAALQALSDCDFGADLTDKDFRDIVKNAKKALELSKPLQF